VGFANSNKDKNLVIVVDVFLGPNGRRVNGRLRGHKKTAIDIEGVRHGNLFVFNAAGKQLFPRVQEDKPNKSEHHRRHHQSEHRNRHQKRENHHRREHKHRQRHQHREKQENRPRQHHAQRHEHGQRQQKQ